MLPLRIHNLVKSYCLVVFVCEICRYIESTSFVFGVSKIQSKSAVDIAKVCAAKSNKCNKISKPMFNDELKIEEHIDATIKDRAKNEGKAVQIILRKSFGVMDGDCSMHILNTIGDRCYLLFNTQN